MQRVNNLKDSSRVPFVMREGGRVEGKDFNGFLDLKL